MKNYTLYIVLAVLVIGGGAYFAYANKFAVGGELVNQMPLTSGENAQPGSSIHDLPVEPAAAKARADLAAKLGISEKSITILKITDKEWSDGCLGLGQAHESCLQALVPGFEVGMLAKGKTYMYRTDTSGDSLRVQE